MRVRAGDWPRSPRTFHRVGICGLAGLIVAVSAAAAPAAEPCDIEHLRQKYRDEDCRPRMTPAELAVGDARTFTVFARCADNWSGVQLSAGVHYELVAANVADWCDSTINVTEGPRGYKDHPSWFMALGFFLARPFRRKADAYWFQLIGGTSDEREALFPICGSESPPGSCSLLRFTPQFGGELRAFANDLPITYSNNYGRVDLIV